jgi:hypothetical protein
MSILLVSRIERDAGRCSAKYGDQWRQYTTMVPYKLIPGIY